MTDEKLNTALEIKGKQSVAEQQISHLKQLIEKVEYHEEPVRLNFFFNSKDFFTKPLIHGLIEVFQNLHSSLDLEFSKL